MKPRTPLILALTIAALGLTACADQPQTVLTTEHVANTSAPVKGGPAPVPSATFTPVKGGPAPVPDPASTPLEPTDPNAPSTPARRGPAPTGPTAEAKGPVPVPDPSTPVKGAPAPMGVLKGRLYVTGGPAPGMKEPRAGTVIVTGAGFHREIAVGEDGAYSVAVPPGTYTISGTNPRIAPAPCTGESGVTVRNGAAVTVEVTCPVP